MNTNVVGNSATGVSAGTPWHLWLVGVLSAVWNVGGVLDWTMTKTHNAAYLAQMTPDQIAWMDAFPWWAQLAWAAGVWGAELGSLLLLLRSRYAVPVFAVSLAALALGTLYQFGISRMPGGIMTTGNLVFMAAIWVVAIALLVYAAWTRRRGILR